MENESHIRVVLKDNTILDFDGKCTNVEYKKMINFVNSQMRTIKRIICWR